MRYLKERKRLLTVFDCFSFSFFFGFQRGPNLCQGLTLSKCWQVGHTSSVVKNICQIWEWLICNVCTLVSFFFWFGLICHIYGWMDGWILQIIRTRGCIWCALLHRFRDDGCSVASNAGIVYAVQSKLIILLFWILDLLNWLIWIMNNRVHTHTAYAGGDGGHKAAAGEGALPGGCPRHPWPPSLQPLAQIVGSSLLCVIQPKGNETHDGLIRSQLEHQPVKVKRMQHPHYTFSVHI